MPPSARLAATFAQRYPSGYRKLGSTGLEVSALGFGSYRVDGRHEHKAALSHALENGINLLDTASNYTDGHSEREIGRASCRERVL